MKTSELNGSALDWVVAKCEEKFLTPFDEHFRRLCSHSGHSPVRTDQLLHNQPLKGKWCVLGGNGFGQAIPNYHTDWAQAGPIIDREEIDTYCYESPKAGCGWYIAEITGTKAKGRGNTRMIAAMRCYVARKLGDCVEIPEKLNE